VSDLLELQGLVVGYGPIMAVRGIDITVGEGEAVCIIGANGAGKSTTLKAVAGLLRPTEGRISFDGQDILGRRSAQIAKRGVALVPEGREVIPSLSVEENLELGCFASKDPLDVQELFNLFPILEERLKQRASTLSGGEQQMLAVARALIGRPRLLMLDEPSMGLAPIVVANLFRRIRDIVASGVTLLLVEQNAPMALSVVQRGYVMASGEVVAAGTVAELRADDRLRAAYFGG